MRIKREIDPYYSSGIDGVEPMPQITLTQVEIDDLWIELKEMEGESEVLDGIREKLRRLATCSY